MSNDYSTQNIDVDELSAMMNCGSRRLYMCIQTHAWPIWLSRKKQTSTTNTSCGIYVCSESSYHKFDLA